MLIRDMFKDDINRKINGVVKVDQDNEEVIVQEVDEYVITRDLKKHFVTFFKNYSESFREPVSDIGVWVSGFFGSGKSHFVKILSYILENREIKGISTVKRFEEKFANDRDIYDMILQSTGGNTDTILFNIDIVGPKNKNNTAVLHVFAKMFYDHLGYYGENLKVALMEQYIDSEGKFEEFKAAFEKYKGKSWIDQRRAFAFNGGPVKKALVEVLGMSEADAQEWFSSKKDEDYSIETLVKDIKAYVDKQPEGYRLMFMADEVGQYTGGDTSLLLNLQSLVEEIGAACEGKVWVICTGQEAIDEIIKARENEFSRIQARFKTRLSLTSSSVDEVIQERILKKKPDYEAPLKAVYQSNEGTIRNLFSFTDSVLDIKGYGSANDFYKNFPFVPYQFIIMQKVFSEIRKHGNTGKHLSGGERSMLSGFQEASQKIQNSDEFSIAPFYMFYDTVHSFLDSAIRKVIDRATKAAEDGNGLENYDVSLLKLLYLIRYVDDIPSNIDNIAILMASDINVDMIKQREIIRASLDRLVKQNYVAISGDIYNFLTDEEQDIEREIKNTDVDMANITNKIGSIIFSEIYQNKKFKYDKYDFAFDQYVDQAAVVNGTGGVVLKIFTAATSDTDKNITQLLIDSKGQAIVVLSDTPYFDCIQNAMKIRKYVKQRNVSMLPPSIQNIIRGKQDNAGRYEDQAKDYIKAAIEKGEFYIDGDKADRLTGDAKSKLDQTLKSLIERVYSCLTMITNNIDNDGEIMDILTGKVTYMEGLEPNQDAMRKISEYLDMQARQNLPTSMADIQRRYQAVPYGWREIDIAQVIAQLIVAQKVDIKYAGEAILSNNNKLPDMLRKKTEIGNTMISLHKNVGGADLKEAKGIMVEYFDVMDVPSDEKGLVPFIIENFTKQKDHYQSLINRYDENHNYPDYNALKDAIDLIDSILEQRKDNIALVKAVTKQEDELFDSKDDLASLEDFFKSQINLFDQGLKFLDELRNDEGYIEHDKDAAESMKEIHAILTVPRGKRYDYKRIPQLNQLMSKVRSYHMIVLANKRKQIEGEVDSCIEVVSKEVGDNSKIQMLIKQTVDKLELKRNSAKECTCLALLDGMFTQLWSIRDEALTKIGELKNRPVEDTEDTPAAPVQNIKSYQRQAIFTGTTLFTEEDVNEYLRDIRTTLLDLLKDSDGIRIN